MKIMVPLSDMNDIETFRKAGADEFYFGFYSEQWDCRFGIFEELNRMSSFGSRANIAFEDVSTVIERVRACGGEAFLTLNSPGYSSAELQFIRNFADDLRRFRLNGVIASDIRLCQILMEEGIPVSLSTMAGVCNSLMMEFYYRLGIRRVILPRDIQFQDLVRIVQRFPDVQFECFILRNGCRYSDSNCLSFHSRKCGAVCAYLNRLPCQIQYERRPTVDEIREIRANHTLYTRAFHQSACGLCAVGPLREAGVYSLKIVGRADKKQELLHDISVLRSLLDHNRGDTSVSSENCLYGLNCYYPSANARLTETGK